MIYRSDDLAEKIYEISILQQNFINNQLKKMNLNNMQARSLNYIYLNPGTIQRDLANYLGKQQATVTNILKSLEEKNLIYREIPQDNARQKNIRLTAEGGEVIQDVKKIFELLVEKVNQPFTEAEQKKLQADLIKVEECLKENR
ncbi:MarR family transcriptional repressor of mepA [Enterococcus sp. PF1-24]|uniref:MarR family winged helix-turn-helix transcriptional regulator n=1 Tax=unclassified Enterococcus TaxID=2608891 RepID=UPI00247631F9|nr:MULTISPECIES: MarR family transcriptional regulator [unclassified Enterococcus]MDH6364659.1 MarR family transcriptional repressor of mepA [Enterococcus sp. PFB1-1]MDH6401760.1 MarR family transcriptional repressor of mepA [Enterococcus sp. PF1-24]